MASMVSALSITNGDFEALSIREDVPDWFESSSTWIRLRYSPNDTRYMRLADDDDWAYQSIGVNTGLPALQIQYEIGSVEDVPDAPALDLVMSVSIYESDGSFEGRDGRNINGAAGVTLIDSVEVSYPAMAAGEYITDSVTLQYLDSASGELFLRFENIGDGDDETDDRFSIDNVQIVGLVPSVVNPLPKDGTEGVAIELTSAENDLVFTVVDDDIVEIDVLLAPGDPNLLTVPANKIVDGMSVSSGNQYTITLETELAADLAWSTEYFWQVLAYEPNGLELSLKYASPISSYTTIQEGPLLGDVDPGKLYVHPGEDAEFTLTMSSKADTFQWYKEGVGALSNGADYAGVDTDTLTVLDAQLADEGLYYCVGTETSSGLTDQSGTSGELKIKLLMTHYTFETTYEDSGKTYTPDIISGKDMELKYGASLSDVNSIIGNNLWLDNPVGNAYAQIADNTVADYDDITISFWCYATTLVNSTDGDRWARIFDFGKDASEYIFFTMLYRQDDARQGGKDVARCEMRYYDENNAEQNPELDVESDEIAAGKWYFIAITIEADEDGSGGSGRIYLSGEHGTEGESPQRLNLPKLTEITKTIHYIGKNIGFSAPLFNGRIDDFKIYNYVRTSAEIAQDYTDVTGDESLCDMEVYDLWDYDYDSNCQVGLSDFMVIAEKWMASYRVFPD